ncbi:hypothetical protein ACFLT2_02170 [Acidobacteriota bacterium]
MRTALDRKKKRFIHYLVGVPLAIILIVANAILISWLFHILITSFANDLDHMSLYKWADHLYTMIKDVIDNVLRAFRSN